MALPPSEAVLLLGSNGVRRVAALAGAVAFLEGMGVEVTALSSLYASAPFGRSGQPWFLNRAAAVRTSLAPRELLEAAKEAERRAGRGPSPRWGPRELDVDILLYGGLLVAEEGLSIPHAGLPSRRFALLPLSEVAPRAVVPPGGKTVAELLSECKDETEVRKI